MKREHRISSLLPFDPGARPDAKKYYDSLVQEWLRDENDPLKVIHTDRRNLSPEGFRLAHDAYKRLLRAKLKLRDSASAALLFPLKTDEKIKHDAALEIYTRRGGSPTLHPGAFKLFLAFIHDKEYGGPAFGKASPVLEFAFPKAPKPP